MGVTLSQGKRRWRQFQSAIFDELYRTYLLCSNTSVCAAIQNTLRSSLNKQFRSIAKTSWLQRNAVGRHGFPVSGELEGEFFLPLGLHVLAHGNGRSTSVKALFAHSVWVDLLSQHNEGCLGGLSYLLKCLLELIEVNGGVIAHDADGSNLMQTFKLGALDLLALQEDIANGFIGGASDLELVE